MQEYKETGRFTPLDLKGDPKETSIHTSNNLASPIDERQTEFSFDEDDLTHVLKDHPGPSTSHESHNSDDDVVPDSDLEVDIKVFFSLASILFSRISRDLVRFWKNSASEELLLFIWGLCNVYA